MPKTEVTTGATSIFLLGQRGLSPTLEAAPTDAYHHILASTVITLTSGLRWAPVYGMPRCLMS
jgi:hypothetical protein